MSIINAMPRILRGYWLVSVVLVGFGVTACKGDTGEAGPEGPPGEPGPPGETPSDELELEPLGLVGRISEPNLMSVAGGTVYLVPASDVETLGETPIDLFLSPEDTAALDVDEPIEDLIDANASTYEQAEVDATGVYRFEMLPEGSHFVVWMPAIDDTQHLPGGSSSTAALDTAQLVGMQLDIEVSSQPGPNATYVGSSTCMVCHGLHSTTRTAHNVGLQVPGVRAILQDIEEWPRFDEALAEFDASTDLFFYDCDPGSLNLSKCKVDSQDPGVGVSFELRLRRDASVPFGRVGAYYVEMAAGLDTERYDVALTYGGALGKQQYLTRRSNADGSLSYFVLPVQYNYEGDTSNDSSDDWPWRDYRSDLWFDFGGSALAQPGNAESFDNNCAGCHFTGYSLRGSDFDGWSAAAVVDSQGAFDYDGDGRTELINVGCESCHGPGSDHLMPATNGRFMVSPGLLTPGRQAALCGRCHSRPLGIGAGETGLPLSADDEMPLPGIRRAKLAMDHTTRVSGAPGDFFSSGDPAANYQQYSDHIRARHYRNPERILTCTACHSPHASFADVYSMEDDLNVVCTVCHADVIPVVDHVEAQTGFDHSSTTMDFLCTECHMVPTAKSGASVPALLDAIPGGTTPVQYFWNDIAAHRMIVVGRDAFSEQPVAATNRCAVCHGGFFPNP